MNADQLRQLQGPIKTRYKEQPEAAKHAFRASGTLLPDRPSVRIDTPFARYDAGLHEKAGGDGSEACSGDLLLEALVACAGVTFNVVATALGVAFRSVQVVVEGEGDFRGTLGLAKDVPVGITDIRLRFDVDSDASDEQLATLLKLTERYCVIFQTLRTPPRLSATLQRHRLILETILSNPLYDGCSVGELFISAIARGGERTAFIGDHTRWTYRELGARVSQVVQALHARGLQRGDAVATLSGNRPEAFLITAAAYLMGLRLTWMNPTSSEDDHAYILEDSGVATLFVDPGMFGERARTLAQRVPGLQRLMCFGLNDGVGEDLLAASDAFAPQRLVAQAAADDVCVLVYTGGTTGRPKGVAHTHRVHVTMILTEMADWDWPREVRFLALTPITHASGAMIMPVLLKSGTYAMTQGFTPEKFVRLVQEHRITATFLVPTMIYVLLDSPARQGADLSSLQLVIYGASPMSPARLIEGMKVFGPVFMQLYAQSEAPNTVTVLHQHEHDPEHHPERLASCGTPCAGVLVRLLDDEGHEVAEGEVGEICVRGPLVMKGYWNKPDETAVALRHGWLYTGDMARRDADGYLYIVDRSKDMIISGGFNVYPREVEDVLSQHTAVAAAAVVGIPDAKWGEAVHAQVVLRAGASVPAEELMALVRERKGAVQAPKSIEFVAALPVTGLGKLDKKAIRARFWQGQQRAVH